ncbi:contractile injection system protein, VgrG/Pvc8 family [Breoghania sp.]|uniref:phage late control D family protein n=1 Tax=Breoghania sp. TaxID=2065378 RepID=UPI002AA8EC3F|nr:contractile injection system protein, VgrG/Pvc8 family [Breoghania sp.]
MRPIVRIFAGGNEITGALHDRLLSVEVIDSAEDKSDGVSLVIDDRSRISDGAFVAIPVINTELTVILGYAGGASASFGPYLIDNVSISSPPREISASGKSAAMAKAYRTPRTESYHQETLGAIIGKIASRNGYTPAIDAGLSAIVIRHEDQNGESDMAFASRLAAKYDAVARPVGGRLVVVQRGAGTSASGATIPSVTVAETACASWTFNYSARDEAGKAGGLDGAGSGASATAGAAGSGTSGAGAAGAADSATPGGVRAFYIDRREGERIAVTAGSAPYHDIRYTFRNAAEAQAAADSYRNRSQRGKASFRCQIGGRVDVQAEAMLLLVGFRPYMPTIWRIKQVRHVFDAGGYVTEIDAEVFAAEESGEQKKVSESVKETAPIEDDLIDKTAPDKNVADSAT